MESTSSVTAFDAPKVWDFLTAVYFAVLCVAARSFLDGFFFRRLAAWLLHKGATPLKINESTQAKIVKCSESMWKLFFYGSVEIWILKIAYEEPWFTDPKILYRDWPNQELRLSLKLYYMCQCGFYLFSIAALLTWETRRKDFAVMMSHHVVTVTLLSYSYLTSFFRPGAIILALHDASDVFMEAAKVFKYSENEFGASFCFGLFALSWVVLRLIVFPFGVIRSSSYDVQFFVPLHEARITLMYYVINTMLLTLLVFHVYWWLLICSMIKKQLSNSGQVGEDIRSDSEDDE